MKTKLDLAHEYMQNTLKLLREHNVPYDFKALIEESFDYADAMQAEAEKRNQDSRSLTKDENGNCLHFHHEFGHKKCMDCGKSLEEWQPDWSQAPKWANWWAMDGFSEKANWYIDKLYIDDDSDYEWNIDLRSNTETYTYAPSFDYKGRWKDSLRKRPEVIK